MDQPERDPGPGPQRRGKLQELKLAVPAQKGRRGGQVLPRGERGQRRVCSTGLASPKVSASARPLPIATPRAPKPIRANAPTACARTSEGLPARSTSASIRGRSRFMRLRGSVRSAGRKMRNTNIEMRNVGRWLPRRSLILWTSKHATRTYSRDEDFATRRFAAACGRRRSTSPLATRRARARPGHPTRSRPPGRPAPCRRRTRFMAKSKMRTSISSPASAS